VLFHNRAGRVTVASQEAARLLGVTPEDLVGRPSPFQPVPVTGDEAVSAAQQPAMLALETGRPQSPTILAAQSGGQTRWFEVSAEPLFKVDGVSVYAAVTRFEWLPRPPAGA
jgi:PAS domain S-box-containing protein